MFEKPQSIDRSIFFQVIIDVTAVFVVHALLMGQLDRLEVCNASHSRRLQAAEELCCKNGGVDSILQRCPVFL